VTCPTEVAGPLIDADAETVRAMLRTVPTTLADIRALVRINECELRGDDVLNTYMSDDMGEDRRGLGGPALLATLAAALDVIAA
jgi:hypothetical protein